MKLFFIILTVAIVLLMAFGCGSEGNRDIFSSNPPPGNNNDDSGNDDQENNDLVELEKQKIVSIHYSLSQALMDKDYEKAITFSNDSGTMRGNIQDFKDYYWDDGEQAYLYFSNVEAIINSPLRYCMGGAQGDVIIIQDKQTLQGTFTTTCTKKEDEWLIVSFFFEN